MAKNNTTATVQVQENAVGSAQSDIAQSAQDAAKRAEERKTVIASLTHAEVGAIVKSLSFSEVIGIALMSAHWTDILAAADSLAAKIKDLGIAEKTVGAQARKIGTLLPFESARFRAAVVSYQLSGRRSNPAQGAELASKLPSLRKMGSLRSGEVTFGSVVLPPTLGEF